MQKYLRDILSNPPHGLGAVSNILLLFSIVLLLSVFFVQPEDKDIMLNLMPSKPSVKVIEARNQLAKEKYAKLYALAKEGQVVEKGDTIYSALSQVDMNTINAWKASLNESKLKPTAQMLAMPFVDARIKNKMIDLAKIKTPTKKVDHKRIQHLETEVSELNTSIGRLKSAIEEFKALDKNYKKDYARAIEKYQAKLISLADLKRVKNKENENLSILKIRQQELESIKHLLFDANSELDSLNKDKAMAKRMKITVDNTTHEADLNYALDSLMNSSFVLATYDGGLEAVIDHVDVAVGDTLITYAGEEIQTHQSNKLLAVIINPQDASRVYTGREALISLEDDSTIKGKVIDSNKTEDGTFEIETEVPLSDMEVVQIILPSKSDNFIEKVLENF